MKYLRIILPVMAAVLCLVSSTAFAAGNELAENSTFLNDLEKKISDFKISDLDEFFGLKSFVKADKIYITKEQIFIVILAAIVVAALFAVLISVLVRRKARIRQLERDKKELKIREEALLEEKRRRIANRQRTIDSKRIDAERGQLIEVLKKVIERKKYDEIMKEQDMLLEEQPWLRADRD